MGFNHLCDSMLLFFTCVALLIDTLVLAGSCFLPFWFTLNISPEDARYGSEDIPESYYINSGLFFMSTDGYVDMIFMSKISNHRFGPRAVIAGQVLYFIGTCGIAACLAASFILALRKLGSVVGEFFLAGFITFSSLCVIAGVVVTAIIFMDVDGDTEWMNLPMSNPNRLAPKVTPQSVDMDWGFYVAIVGAVVSVVALLLSWMEALKTCRYIEDIRDKQLSDPNYGRKEEIPYTQFSYEQPYPQTYSVTVPAEHPPQQVYYGEPTPEISRTVDI